MINALDRLAAAWRAFGDAFVKSLGIPRLVEWLSARLAGRP